MLAPARTPARPGKPFAAVPRSIGLTGTCVLAIACLLAFAPGRASATGTNRGDASAEVPPDATLRSVVFVDPDNGWVAGDFGTLLRTVDGGTTWTLQDSGTTDHLQVIRMFTSQRGLAIGGRYDPHTRIGRGTIAWTRDGGKSWKPTESIGLPPLRALLIGPQGRCLAAGDWSPAHMSNLFASSDGGRSWEALPAPSTDPIIGLSGEVSDCLALTDRGEVIRCRDGDRPRAVLPPAAGRTVICFGSGLHWVSGAAPPQYSSDGGRTWQEQGNGPPAAVATAIWMHQELWALGPASANWIRGDLGTFPPPTRIAEAPLRDLFRLDADRGWAVGDWGTICLTRDGGKTWRTVRGGDGRPAVMAVASEAAKLPWSLLGMESLQHRRRVAVVTADDLPTLRQAARQLGPTAEYTWTRPTSHLSERQAWPTGGAAASTTPSELLAHTRPAVLILDGDLDADEKAGWTQAAIQSGVYRVFETGRGNERTLPNSTAMPHAGLLAGDVWTDALTFAAPGKLPPESLRLAARYDAFADRVAIDGLAGFLGEDPRYQRQAALGTSRRNLQILQARANETAWVESIVASTTAAETAIRRLEERLITTTPDQQQRLLYRLLGEAKHKDRPDLYRGLLGMIATRLPEEPLGQIAALLHDAIRNSDEWQQLGMSQLDVSNASNRSPGEPLDAVQITPFQPPPTPGIRLVSGTLESEPALGTPSTGSPKRAMAEDWNWQSHPVVLLARRRTAPELLPPGHPLIRLGEDRPIQREARPRSWIDGWSQLANGPNASAALVARWTAARPLLNGRLDEAMWQTSNSTIAGGSRIRTAYDSEFVYFGITAPPLQPSVGPVNQLRRRDAPLDTSDRYGLKIDVDGDLLTAFELEFDAAGNTRDTCDGFAHWHPTWFVAIGEQSGQLVAEIAVRRSDLVGPLQTPNQHWNLSLVRHHAGRGTAAIVWPHPADWLPMRFD